MHDAHSDNNALSRLYTIVLNLFIKITAFEKSSLSAHKRLKNVFYLECVFITLKNIPYALLTRHNKINCWHFRIWYRTCYDRFFLQRYSTLTINWYLMLRCCSWWPRFLGIFSKKYNRLNSWDAFRRLIFLKLFYNVAAILELPARYFQERFIILHQLIDLFVAKSLLASLSFFEPKWHFLFL